jgi:nucleotide-binding universal stress UspA family protein
MALRDVLLSPTTDLGTDMLVAGAYHHSELREALVGGVSCDLLDHMTVPVLMSHWISAGPNVMGSGLWISG